VNFKGQQDLAEPIPPGVESTIINDLDSHRVNAVFPLSNSLSK